MQLAERIGMFVSSFESFSPLKKKTIKAYPKQAPQETNTQGIFPKEEGFTLCHISIALSTRLSG